MNQCYFFFFSKDCLIYKKVKFDRYLNEANFTPISLFYTYKITNLLKNKTCIVYILFHNTDIQVILDYAK